MLPLVWLSGRQPLGLVSAASMLLSFEGVARAAAPKTVHPLAIQLGSFQHVFVEPYAEPEVYFLQGQWEGSILQPGAVRQAPSAGDVLRIRRENDFTLNVEPLGAECWGKSSGLPPDAEGLCCGAQNVSGCFDKVFNRQRCCESRVLPGPVPEEVFAQLRKALPFSAVDEEAYLARKSRFSFGHRGRVHSICYEGSLPDLDSQPRETTLAGIYGALFRSAHASTASADGATSTVSSQPRRQRQQEQHQLWPRLTQRFVSLGASDGKTDDPIFPIATAFNLSGVLLEADGGRFALLQETFHDFSGNVKLLQAEVTPDNLNGFLDKSPWGPQDCDGQACSTRVDLAAVDIDSWDCVVAVELAKAASPLLLHLELNPSVPPPFHFARLYSPRLSVWDGDLATRFLGSTSCSLSHATQALGNLGYALLAFDGYNGIFVHQRAWNAIERLYPGLRLPQDEFECYRRSRVWLTSLTPSIVRDWFFRAEDAHVVLDLIWGNLTQLAREEGFGDLPISLGLD